MDDAILKLHNSRSPPHSVLPVCVGVCVIVAPVLQKGTKRAQNVHTRNQEPECAQHWPLGCIASIQHARTLDNRGFSLSLASTAHHTQVEPLRYATAGASAQRSTCSGQLLRAASLPARWGYSHRATSVVTRPSLQLSCQVTSTAMSGQTEPPRPKVGVGVLVTRILDTARQVLIGKRCVALSAGAKPGFRKYRTAALQVTLLAFCTEGRLAGEPTRFPGTPSLLEELWCPGPRRRKGSHGAGTWALPGMKFAGHNCRSRGARTRAECPSVTAQAKPACQVECYAACACPCPSGGHLELGEDFETCAVR
jgi:hypothetical protein